MSQLLSEAAQALIDAHRAQQDQQDQQDQQEPQEMTVEEMLGLAEAPAPAAPAAAVPGLRPKAFVAAAATVRRPPYTPTAMIDLMVEHPEYSHSQFAAHFGYKASWFAGILISNNFQAALSPRRTEVSNPMLTGTMDDLFRAMTVQALTVLQARLDSPVASEDLIIKAIGQGVKALGMGTAGALPQAPEKPATLADLATRLSAPKAVEAETAVTVRDYTIDATLNELKQ